MAKSGGNGSDRPRDTVGRPVGGKRAGGKRAGGKRREGSAAEAPRRNGPRPVGALLPEISGTAMRRFGFSQAVLVSRWSEIAGPLYGRWSLPVLLKPGQGGGTLTVRVEGPFAVQMQHIVPQLIERVNQLLGPGSVARLRLLQGSVADPAEAPAESLAETSKPATANLAAPTAQALLGVGNSGLRQALEDLARALAAGTRPPPVR